MNRFTVKRLGSKNIRKSKIREGHVRFLTSCHDDTGPDVGLDKLASCPGSPHRGPPHVLSPWYSRLEWASTAPLLKATHGPPHV